MFSCEFCEFINSTFFREHLRATAFGNIFGEDHFVVKLYDVGIERFKRVLSLAIS